MNELHIGDPSLPATDVGPVINKGAASKLEDTARRSRRKGVKVLKQCDLNQVRTEGSYFAPRMLELNNAAS